MKLITASVLSVCLAISFATTGVAALPSAEPDSVGPLARDTMSRDASNTTADASAANPKGKYFCPSIYLRVGGLTLGFDCDVAGYATVTAKPPQAFSLYSLEYDGTDCIIQDLVTNEYVRPSVVYGFRDYLTTSTMAGAVHCNFDPEQKTVQLKDNIHGYVYGHGKDADVIQYDRCGGYYLDSDDSPNLTFNMVNTGQQGCYQTQ